MREALRAAGVEAAGPEELGARVAVVPATLAKGLEYDHVVAVEPAAVAEAEGRPAPAVRGAHPGRVAAGGRARAAPALVTRRLPGPGPSV
ncbi:hypothetical protein ACFVVY_36900 [Streptomyces mirabilis]|uniref:hypothetical protein n=1 Tax=Streptomyces mirabilis TaxID=68239 RepID=UPI0036DF37D5